jgi:hypothetical protein
VVRFDAIIAAKTLRQDDNMETTKPTPENFQPPGLYAGKLFDIIVKAAVILAALIYSCGFIVISLSQHSYGIAEANPLRPKVLAAGIWFLIFAALPFLIVTETRIFRPRSTDSDSDPFRRTSGATIFGCTAASIALGMLLLRMFEIPQGAEQWGYETFTIVIAMLICMILVIADKREHFPHWLVLPVSLASCALLLFSGGRDLISHRQSLASIALWFMASSWFVALEMRARSWKLQLGNWYQSLGWSITFLAVFSSIYYPQIQTSWGGGAPISAIIYFTKDSPLLPNRNVSAKILDETDAGFYLVGANDKRATFIPRSGIAMIYYSDDSSGPFIVKTK